MLQEILDSIAPGWEAQDSFDDSALICPCGHVIEQDGKCPEGCVSPLRAMGMI